MKMKRILFTILILVSLVACAQKPETQTTNPILLPEFPSPSPAVLAKLTDLNDYEVNAWLIKITNFKKEINKLK